MEYKDLVRIFTAHEAAEPKYHLDGHITFSNFGAYEDPGYTLLDRTYLVSSNNKAYKPNQLGYSIFGSCLNGQDSCVRLESYMRQPNGWIPGECCLLFYQLQSVNERMIYPPKLFSSHRQAVEAMLQDLCLRGGDWDYPDVLRTFNLHGQIENIEDNFGADRHSAWLENYETGNWDWQIQPIQVYDLQHISVGIGFPGEEDRK